MLLSPLLFACAAGGATFLGGTLTLRLPHALGVFVALAAGAVTGVALFDLWPTALQIGATHHGPMAILALVAAGMMVYRLVHGRTTTRPTRTPFQVGPAILSFHSLMDGIGIGVAFDFSRSTGLLVACAVLAHDIADGINTVGVSLAHGNHIHARRWLAVNACAPLAGVLIGGLFHPSDALFSVLLALMAGLFLAIGLTELAPRSLSLRPRASSVLLIVAGAAAILGITRLTG